MTYYYKTVSEILAEMVKDDALSETQAEGIKKLCDMAQKRHREDLKKVLNKAYEAGRQHDMAERVSIALDIENDVYDLVEIKDGG